MKTTAEDIGWGKYKTWEGPYFHGTQKFVLPANPSEAYKQMAVLAATEGGAWDAYNGYDICKCTSGLIQWCEGNGQYSVSDMLGKVAEADAALLNPFFEATDELDGISGKTITFEKGAKGKWRFFLDGDEVNTAEEQNQLFFCGASGELGGWGDEDDPRRHYAKAIAAGISNVWRDPQAQTIQAEFTLKRLDWFILKDVKDIFDAMPDTPLAHGFKAAYLSYAGNNPTRAAKSLNGARLRTDRWSKDWVNAVLCSMAFDHGIAIYPGRYNKIRPVVEKLYGIDLIDTAELLKDWSARHGIDPVEPAAVQRALIALGYDLGPAGADGVIGKKTKDAVLMFENTQGMSNPNSEIDASTVKQLRKELDRRGIILKL